MRSTLSNSLKTLQGTLQVPADKSISHRALIFNALAKGAAVIQNVLSADDIFATINVLQQLGVHIEWLDKSTLKIQGIGGQFHQPKQPLYFANSGTAARILLGALAASPIQVTLTGDASLSKRPMTRVLQPLQQMGLITQLESNLPITIKGNSNLQGIDYELPVPSAQVKTAILCAAIQATGSTKIIQTQHSRDHSERLLELMGAKITQNNLTLSVVGQQRLHATSLTIPGDFSSAAFWLVAACLTKDSDLKLTNVGINPSRIALLTILKQMGANILISNTQTISNELIADIQVSYSKLSGINVPKALIPNLQDEIPILLIAAAFAEGTTIIRGAAELRVKESDRLEAMYQGLTACGITSRIYSDGIDIQGGEMHSAEVDSFGDHRVAMAFIIAKNCSRQKIVVQNTECINTSYPNFLDHCGD